MDSSKRWIFGLVVVLLVIGAFTYIGFKDSGKKETQTPEVSGVATNEAYYSDTATVMEFYSDYCSWCIKEKEVLTKLGAEGYRVKPMNVGKDQSLWEKYNIKGTPAFIAANGDRLEGYNTEDKLRAFLDSHK